MFFSYTMLFFVVNHLLVALLEGHLHCLLYKAFLAQSQRGKKTEVFLQLFVTFVCFLIQGIDALCRKLSMETRTPHFPTKSCCEVHKEDHTEEEKNSVSYIQTSMSCCDLSIMDCQVYGYICTLFCWFCGFTYIFLCHVKMVQNKERSCQNLVKMMWIFSTKLYINSCYNH